MQGLLRAHSVYLQESFLSVLFRLPSMFCCYKLRSGFTLIELLIVMAILGILAAAVFAALNPGKRQRQAKDSQIKSDIGQIATGLQTYFTASGKGSYPDDVGNIIDSGDLKFLPKPPSGAGNQYNYQVDPIGCDEVNTVCSAAVVWAPLFDPSSSGNVWCWRTSAGRAEEIASGVCTP